MRWSLPAWASIVGGLIAIVGSVAMYWEVRNGGALGPQAMMSSALFVGGSILLAAGLHAMQASMDAWCDCADCMGSACSCNHCEDCVDGECCGKCACSDDGGGKAYVHMPST
jgi:hypothetical protein